MSLSRPSKLCLILSSLFIASCFDEPATLPICFDRRDHLIAKAEIKQLVSNEELDGLSPLYSPDEKKEAIRSFEEQLFRELTEERALSCGLSADFSGGQCRSSYPILFNDSFRSFDPSYYRAPWLYLIGEREVSETVTACDLILDDEHHCLSTAECDAGERCIALSIDNELPKSEGDTFGRSLGDKLGLSITEVVSSYCGQEEGSCTRCLTRCESDEDCSSPSERCVIPQQATHGICLSGEID